jgi:hypothetical protein
MHMDICLGYLGCRCCAGLVGYMGWYTNCSVSNCCTEMSLPALWFLTTSRKTSKRHSRSWGPAVCSGWNWTLDRNGSMSAEYITQLNPFPLFHFLSAIAQVGKIQRKTLSHGKYKTHVICCCYTCTTRRDVKRHKKTDLTISVQS